MTQDEHEKFKAQRDAEIEQVSVLLRRIAALQVEHRQKLAALDQMKREESSVGCELRNKQIELAKRLARSPLIDPRETVEQIQNAHGKILAGTRLEVTA